MNNNTIIIKNNIDIAFDLFDKKFYKKSKEKFLEIYNGINNNNEEMISLKLELYYYSIVCDKYYIESITPIDYSSLQIVQNNLYNILFNIDISLLKSKLINDIITNHTSCCTHLVNYYKDITYLYKAIEFDSCNSILYYNLGILLFNENKISESICNYKIAISFENNPQYYINLALLYKDLSNYTYYLKYLNDGLDKNKNSSILLNEYGIIQMVNNNFDNSFDYFSNALKYTTDNILLSKIYQNIGCLYSLQGKTEEAIENYNKSLELNESNVIAFQNILLNLNYINLDNEEIFNRHKKINEFYKLQYNVNKPKLNNKIRIGYVSGDFFNHAVSNFIKVLFNDFNIDKFEIYCFSSTYISFEKTKLFPKVNFYNIKTTMSINDISNYIKSLSIDILIDLSGHTLGNRLDIFSNKCAPIQISYIGYPNTTGLETIDYKIVDNYTDNDDSQKYYTEKLLKLPKSFICYTIPDKIPKIETKYKEIHIGSFAKLSKLNKNVLDIWIKIVKEFNNVKLVLKCRSPDLFWKNSKFNCLKEIKDSIILLNYTKTFYEHLQCYNLLDLTLDTFPYSGTTITCESLLMGVPVITLKGNSHVQNVSYSIINNTFYNTNDKYNFISHTEEDYYNKIKNWILLNNKNDKEFIRTCFLNSYVTNSKNFINEYENILKSLIQ